LSICGDAPRLRENRSVGRVDRSFRKSFVYNTLRKIIMRPSVHPPHEGAGAHLGAACPAACHFVLCQQQYTIESTYRANRAEFH
jgi:hypothetical protein